jgi:hypothetical protein
MVVDVSVRFRHVPRCHPLQSLCLRNTINNRCVPLTGETGPSTKAIRATRNEIDGETVLHLLKSNSQTSAGASNY